MKSTRVLKAAGLVLAAVVLGLLTVQGSYALWNKAVSANAGTIQAASFDVEMKSSAGTSLMTLDSGAKGTVPLNAGTVNAGASAFTGVQLANKSNAGGQFTIRASAGTPITSGPWRVEHRIVPGTDPAACTAAAYKASTADTADIPKGGAGVFCFQISLAETASIQGQQVALTVPLEVVQIGKER